MIAGERIRGLSLKAIVFYLVDSFAHHCQALPSYSFPIYTGNLANISSLSSMEGLAVNLVTPPEGT